MTKDEYKLLDNAITGLDRLFDFQTSVYDLYALIVATSRALAGTEYSPILDKTSDALYRLVTSDDKVSDERLEALAITDDLRIFIAEKLEPYDSQEISI